MTRKRITAKSGRKYYHHDSGLGFVMEWFDNGALIKTFVSYMKYCGFGVYQSGHDKAHAIYFELRPASQSYNRFVTDREYSKLKDSDIDDLLLPDSKYIIYYDPNTATESDDAKKLCSNVVVDGVNCTLPSIDILFRLFCDVDAIQKLDPSTINCFGKECGWMDWFNNTAAFSINTYDNQSIFTVESTGMISCRHARFSYSGIIPTTQINI